MSLTGASSGDVALTGRELAVHVYAPVRGPHSERAYAFLCEVWARWRSTLGADAPIAAFGIPDLPSANRTDVVGNGLVVAQESSGPGVCQTILQREHDVLCLSGMIAPLSSDEVSWADLDRSWTQVCGAVPEGLLGIARLYLAKLGGDRQQRVAATARLARSWRADLPAAPAVHDFDGRGVTTRAGFAVWEVGSRDDTRLERRIVVVAPPDRDAELSAWVWSRGDDALTPFAWYLLHAAKLRYHLRVWASGEELRERRRQLDSEVDTLDALIAAGEGAWAGPRGGEGAGPLGEHVLRVEAAAARLARATAYVRDMRRSVAIAASNLETRAARDVDPAVRRCLFADDRDLAAWFARQLADDESYLDEAYGRASLIGGLARSVLARQAGARSSATHNGSAEDAVPSPLSPAERDTLVRALARAFPSDALAHRVLHTLGIPSERRRSATDSTPLAAWSETLHDLDNGIVADPYPRLLRAALGDFPHNPTFRELGAHFGVVGPGT
ncbi:CATRA conflict system CASPASE/TPR repeat-associated protein [Frankia sp. CiP3]|uniref:CATRA conflict system CASPASE/TPR repeat-associated protein n=1 Tax=Frankia sp. CiP3 TaxID=2880971 RepID=UPI001EF4C308|nr:CATRA conflict system CASPASE/TPR repeat-associated protein [Frankia sp. CiP3]